MPFTLSHAAAVLPVVRGDGTGRGRLVPAVLVAGSFAPDMTYYAASAVSGAMTFGAVTHSLPGVLTLDVLVAWVLVGLWLVVREPLVALLPRSLQGRTAALVRCGAPRTRVEASSVLWWYVSAALGALTHVVWDEFTHPDRWGMRQFPLLGQLVAGLPVYTYLQYGSSAVAAVVIAAFLFRALRRAPAGEPAGVPVLSVRDRRRAGAVIVGCAAAGAVQRLARAWAFLREAGAGAGVGARVRDVVPTLCFGAGAGLVVGLLVYAAAVRAWRPARDPAGDPGPDGAGAEAGLRSGR
ncbi:DUF4184 domain-containing protein [Streptomyces sp. NTH33]|uniref:DUF4184 family protein n=1 Tax=Streptomyces sp. NTH33 TaxID=1735453 RepID=UPI000DA718A7|nr:DUF4184 family protein [Streptomyces sp. NTH33]PZG90250.1 DUF4184 domain-containing protein [Streptomyces sp. NTH33]